MIKQVVGFPDYTCDELGNIYNKKGKKMKQLHKIEGNHYRQIELWNNKKMKRKLWHRVITETFIPNPLNKKCVNHKNGIKYDNRVENLEWVTHKENTQHAIKNGLKHNFHARVYDINGEKNSNCKIKDIELALVQYCKRIGMKRIEVYRKYFQNKISITQFDYFWYCFRSRVETSIKYSKMPLEELRKIIDDIKEEE